MRRNWLTFITIWVAGALLAAGATQALLAFGYGWGGWVGGAIIFVTWLAADYWSIRLRRTSISTGAPLTGLRKG
ncbi:MAG: hypothetical protein AB7O04_15280 [Hyphomonadaceae bacterium]